MHYRTGQGEKIPFIFPAHGFSSAANDGSQYSLSSDERLLLI